MVVRLIGGWTSVRSTPTRACACSAIPQATATAKINIPKNLD